MNVRVLWMWLLVCDARANVWAQWSELYANICRPEDTCLDQRGANMCGSMAPTRGRPITSTLDVVDAARVAAAPATVQCYSSGAGGVRAVCS